MPAFAPMQCSVAVPPRGCRRSQPSKRWNPDRLNRRPAKPLTSNRGVRLSQEHEKPFLQQRPPDIRGNPNIFAAVEYAPLIRRWARVGRSLFSSRAGQPKTSTDGAGCRRHACHHTPTSLAALPDSAVGVAGGGGGGAPFGLWSTPEQPGSPGSQASRRPSQAL